MSNEPEAVRILKSAVERIVALEERKAEIAENIKDIYAEVKAKGLSPASLRNVVKRYLETPEQRAKREEVDALTDLYALHVGVAGATPLGEAARRRMSGARPNRHDPDDDPDLIKPAPQPAPEGGAEPEDEPDVMPPVGPDDIEAAKERGEKDAAAGASIYQNPFMADDPRRAAWDQGWCDANASDGMDIPEHLRPRKKPKKEEEPDEGGTDPDEHEDGEE